VSGQLQASGALTPGKEPQYSLDMRLGEGLISGLDDVEKSKSLFLPGLKLRYCGKNLAILQEDRKVAHIKLKVVINCIAVNIIISPTARGYCRGTNE
jgi:hypothetical protein